MNTKRHDIRRRALQTLLIFAAGSATLFAQRASVTQVIRLQVLELNTIDISGGPVTLKITDFDPETSNPSPAMSGATRLVWTSNGENRKITAESDRSGSKFDLRLSAQDVSSGSGVSSSDVVFSDNSTHDLIVGVSRSAGSCTLQFTGAATLEKGVGSETHTITYTITGS
ncbi:MAG TPA: hypothetical protein VMM57_01635 [Bacteroidota bacterium]|nr:hypothetical protein [Bacteroidota bacterium]